MARQGTQSGGTRRGYKETEIGEIPVEWDLDTLGNTSDVKTGGTPSRTISDYWNGDIPWMSSGEVNKKFIIETEEFITELGLKSSNAQYLPVDTVMLALNGQGKTRGTVAITCIKLTCNQSLAGIVFDKHVVYPLFGFFFLENNYQNLRHLTGDDARNGLNLGILRKLYLPLPPLPEQKKIAAILSSVDDAIRSTQAVIDQARTLKKGLLGQLLTRGIGHKKFKQTEIGEIPVEWEVKTLLDIAKVKGGKRLPKGKPFSSQITKYPYIRVSDFREGTVDTSNLQYVDEEVQKTNKRYTITKEDLYISIAGTIGLIGTIPKELDNALLTENAAKITFAKGVVNLEYSKQLLQSSIAQNQFANEKGVGGVPKLALFRIESITIPLPPLAEQKKIAEILSGVDAVIRQNSEQVEQLKKTKSGLMQDLLTGRKRVAV